MIGGSRNRVHDDRFRPFFPSLVSVTDFPFLLLLLSETVSSSERFSIYLFPLGSNSFFFFSLSVSGRFLPFELQRITSYSPSHGAASNVNRFLDFHRFSLPLSPFESADELQPFFFHRSRNEKSLALRASPLPWKRSSDPFTVSCNQREETSSRMHASFSFIIHS